MTAPTQNRLLDALPVEILASLVPHLERVHLPLQAGIYLPGEQPRYVHFMQGGIASVVTDMEGGGAVEVGLVGSEGFPERIHLLGSQSGPTRCFIQVPGDALRMPFDQFRDFFLKTPPLLKTVLQFVQQDSLVLTQLSACNRLHEVEARLARWLLMVSDRVRSSELTLTQEFLGEMLGTRRSSVNLVVGTLQRAGVITFSRGRILIEEREALESVACECYPIVAGLFRSLYA